MAAVTYSRSPQLKQKIFNLLRHGANQKLAKGNLGTSPIGGGFGYSAGVPTDDNAEATPLGLGTMVLDHSNNDVYVCSAYTDGTNYTWTKAVD